MLLALSTVDPPSTYMYTFQTMTECAVRAVNKSPVTLTCVQGSFEFNELHESFHLLIKDINFTFFFILYFGF